MSLLLQKSDTESKASSGKKGFLPAKSSAASKRYDFTKLPRVDLLPLEIVEKRSLKELKVKIFMYLGFLVIAVVLAAVGVNLERGLAESRFENAKTETVRLKAEEAKYAEVPLVLGQIDKAKTALRDAMYREILWADYIGAVAATLPKDAVIAELQVEAATPNNPGPGTLDELQDDLSIGALTFTAVVSEFPDTVKWVNALNSIPGFTDARFSTAEYTKPGSEDVYAFKGTIRITEDAYSGRFEPEPEAEEEVSK